MYPSEKITASLVIILILSFLTINFGQAASSAAEPDSLVITAKVNGIELDIAAPNPVTLPATIVFTANMPATIYYTTSGGDPTTSTTYATITSAKGTAAGPTIDTTDYMLLITGVDAGGSLTPLITYTFVNR